MELFHFDIESVGSYPDYESFKLADDRGAKLFESKFQKMKWDEKYSDINQAYCDNSGIISAYGKIVCISFGYLDNSGKKMIKSYYGDDEKELVNQFNELLKKIETKNFNLCGFRIMYFDIPWILHKLHKYGIKPANIINLYGKKPWDMRITDMSDDWKLKFAWSGSFDEMCYEIDIDSPKDDINGSQVHYTYWGLLTNGLEKIKTYCEKDVSASIDASIKIYNL